MNRSHVISGIAIATIALVGYYNNVRSQSVFAHRNHHHYNYGHHNNHDHGSNRAAGAPTAAGDSGASSGSSGGREVGTGELAIAEHQPEIAGGRD